MARVRLGPKAQTDLRSYRQWLRREAGDPTAESWMDALNAWIAELRDSPERGSPRPDLGPAVRTRVFRRTVMMAYTYRDEIVMVIRVLGRGRDITTETIGDVDSE